MNTHETIDDRQLRPQSDQEGLKQKSTSSTEPDDFNTIILEVMKMPDRIWNAAEYTRLSRDDGDKAESNSITSQKEIIRDYVRQHPEFVIVKEYADDGYSGVNFERRALSR